MGAPDAKCSVDLGNEMVPFLVARRRAVNGAFFSFVHGLLNCKR